ncbi:MAG TPA: ABC-2 transporter permease [Candidatus Krumholzibacteria bacterium]|nr:ABC-2 transporter permease [Candidatus Krumholzibacteria bacterium]HPD72547.1 ABC-2 transporter permease [Candidatus Krumholzibacteria bacterium]HRY40521.1 ABC-2 transporter permease [Candidatus Krumholzibacteria bacterium]
MRNALVIFRREFASYFNSPIAYIFIIVFLLLTGLLFMLNFFLVGQADMRGFFGALPLLLTFFIPAISMRLWAEDRRQGTFELLMTLPMRPHEVMAGKYLAALAFFGVTLVGTLPIPIMLNALGNPDNGTLVTGYLGTLLMGALYLSVGIFTSGLMRDQISAFILGVMACLIMWLLGQTFVAAVFDGWIDGFGRLLQQYLGMTSHFEPMLRGVVALGDLVYFLALTSLFLALNALWLEGRKY